MDGGNLQLPPGFRFHPTDEELVKHYLCRKCAGAPTPVPIIAEVDLYKYDPWLLPGMAMYGEKEWYFFSPRDRKYPNGSRPNRSAGSGYWKATGADKPVGSPRPVSIKKALVFYKGKAPRGEKTNWIMHEYRLANVDRSARKRHSKRLDDWVLCRIYNKKGGAELKPKPDVSHVRQPELADVQQPVSLDDLFCFDASTADSMPRLMGESSGSEPLPLPDFTCDVEVQSEARWGELGRVLGFAAGGGLDPAAGMFGAIDDPLQDMFMYLQKPF